ncbi:MAG TPA: lanthionine synthetase LanC family protein [Gemmatimonadales bacterium]|nr:lanthionine synthetase LanC family protein [Gemmatimonadales bacterium]
MAAAHGGVRVDAMPLAGPQVLPPDVRIVPVADAGARTGSRLRRDGGDFTVSRPGSRHHAKVVGRQAAELLALFRKPRRVADAVLAYARRNGRNPEAVLAAAFPVIRDCCNAGFLVAAGSPEAKAIAPMLRRGDRVGEWRIVRCVQALEDFEVYQASDGRAPAALKILRPGAGELPASLLANEARVVRMLAGRDAPRLLGEGTHRQRPYVVTSWCSGVSPAIAAAELREVGRRDQLLALCGAIAEAYARLHALGVVHADADTRNLLVADNGQVTILDFGFARVLDDRGTTHGVPRAGVGFFAEPEYARAALKGHRPPPATAATDQYAVAALLFALLTGDFHLDFALEQRRALRQIATAAPLPFARRHTRPWPGVERVLRRALSRSPSARYGSMAAFAASLRAAGRRQSTRGGRRAGAWDSGSASLALSKILKQALRSLDPAGPGFAAVLAPPTASVTMGAAGVAAGLCRLACALDDPWLLSAADAWLVRAEREIGRPEAYYDEAIGIPADIVGRTTPYHTASGIHLVRALLSLAVCDSTSADAAAAAFVAASRGPCRSFDLTLGRAGTLLACAMLADALRAGGGAATPAVERLGWATQGRLWRRIAGFPPVPGCAQLPVPGLAHGWAGVLYATLRWHASAGGRPPDGLERRLHELASCAEPNGRGVAWACDHAGPGEEPFTGYSSGWCGGSAGFVHLWTLAHRELGRREFLDLARLSAWHTWEGRERGATLCCSKAGRAYALLNLYRHTGDPVWLSRARALGARAAREVLTPGRAPWRPFSLYKGDLGVAVLAADLERPELACMPMFEDEGWPRLTKT